MFVFGQLLIPIEFLIHSINDETEVFFVFCRQEPDAWWWIEPFRTRDRFEIKQLPFARVHPGDACLAMYSLHGMNAEVNPWQVENLFVGIDQSLISKVC